MPYRSRKEHTPYKKNIKRVRKLPSICDFCEITEGSNQLIEESKSFKVIKNIFPYSFWDMQRVSDHLMIVPKKHTDTISHFSSQEAVEFVGLVGSYESRGYNVYARSPKSSAKSVHHQHTHLIKGHGRHVNFLLYLRRPYTRLMR